MSECSWSGGDVSDADGESSGIRDCPTPTESSTAASDHSSGFGDVMDHEEDGVHLWSACLCCPSKLLRLKLIDNNNWFLQFALYMWYMCPPPRHGGRYACWFRFRWSMFHEMAIGVCWVFGFESYMRVGALRVVMLWVILYPPCLVTSPPFAACFACTFCTDAGWCYFYEWMLHAFSN